MLEDTHKLYEEKLETLETYYQAKLKELKTKCDDTENSDDITDTVNCQIKELLRKITNLQGQINELISDKEKSEEQLLICERRLRDIQSVLTGSYDIAYVDSQVQVIYYSMFREDLLYVRIVQFADKERNFCFKGKQ